MRGPCQEQEKLANVQSDAVEQVDAQIQAQQAKVAQLHKKAEEARDKVASLNRQVAEARARQSDEDLTAREEVQCSWLLHLI